MALETQTVLLPEAWTLLSSTNTDLFEFKALGEDEVLIAFSATQPANPMDGFRSAGGRYTTVGTNKVWGRSMGRRQRVQLLRNVDAANPQIVRLQPVTVTPVAPTTAITAGAKLADVGAPVAGAQLAWEPDLQPGGPRTDRRAALSTDQTQLVAGLQSQEPGTLTGTLVQTHPDSPDSPLRQRVSVPFSVPVLTISGAPPVIYPGLDFAWKPDIAGGYGIVRMSRTGPKLPDGWKFDRVTGFSARGEFISVGLTVDYGVVTVTDESGQSATIAPSAATLTPPPALPAVPLAAGARLAAIGDSQIAYNSTFGNATPTTDKVAWNTGYGPIAWAKMLDTRFRFESWYDVNDPRGMNYVGASQGIHGDHMDNFNVGVKPFLGGILPRLQAYLSVAKPDVIVLEGGVNTFSSGDGPGTQNADYVISKYEKMLQVCRYAGVWVILDVMYPRGDWEANPTTFASNIKNIQDFNRWARAQRGRDGVLDLWDSEPFLRPGGDGTALDLSFYKTDDKVHMNPKGAAQKAISVILPSLQAKIQAGTTFNQDPLVDNLLAPAVANFQGDSGAGLTPGLSVSVDRNVTLTYAKEQVSAGVERQVLNVTPGGSTNGAYYGFTLAGISASEPADPTKWYKAFLEVEYEGSGAAFLTLLGGHRTQDSQALTNIRALHKESSGDWPTVGSPGVRKMWLQSEPFRCDDPLSDRIAMSLQVYGAKAAAAFQVKVGKAIVRRAQDPRVRWGYQTKLSTLLAMPSAGAADKNDPPSHVVIPDMPAAIEGETRNYVSSSGPAFPLDANGRLTRGAAALTPGQAATGTLQRTLDGVALPDVAISVSMTSSVLLANISKSAVIACLGDASVAGYSAGLGTGQGVGAWPSQLSDILEEMGLRVADDSFFGDRGGFILSGTNSIATLLAGTSRLAFTGTFAVSSTSKIVGGAPLFTGTTSGSKMTLSPRRAISKVDVWYVDGAAARTFSVAIGATVQNVVGSGTTKLSKVTVAAAGGAAIQDVVITSTSANSIGIFAVDAYDDTTPQVRVWNWGVSNGGGSAALLDNTYTPRSRLAQMGDYAPDVLLIEGGVHQDMRSSVAVATTKANLTTMVQNAKTYKSSTCKPILVMPPADTSGTGLTANRADYLAAMQQVASEQSVPMVDLGPFAPALASGAYATRAGNRRIARAVRQALDFVA